MTLTWDLLKMQDPRPTESNSGGGCPATWVLISCPGDSRESKCARPWDNGCNATREDSASWAWECRLWAPKSLHVISGFYSLISEVLAEKLSSRVRVVLWSLSRWQSVSGYSKCHFRFIRSSVYVSDKSTHVTNLKFEAKGQYLHSFYYITRCFWLTLYNLITVMEDLQVNLICEVGGLCICLVTYFLPRRTMTALLNVEPLRSLTFPKIKPCFQ